MRLISEKKWKRECQNIFLKNIFAWILEDDYQEIIFSFNFFFKSAFII